MVSYRVRGFEYTIARFRCISYALKQVPAELVCMQVEGCTSRVTVSRFSEGFDHGKYRSLFIHRLYTTGVAGGGDIALQIAPYDADEGLQAVLYVGKRHYPVFAKRLRNDVLDVVDNGGGRMRMSVIVQQAVAYGSSCAVCGDGKRDNTLVIVLHPYGNVGRPWIHPE